MPLQPNPGRCPPECEIRDEHGEVAGHRRVRVVLFGSYDSARKEPGGWASGGRGGCNWRISKPPHSHDIESWELT